MSNRIVSMTADAARALEPYASAPSAAGVPALADIGQPLLQWDPLEQDHTMEIAQGTQVTFLEMTLGSPILIGEGAPEPIVDSIVEMISDVIVAQAGTISGLEARVAALEAAP